MNQEKIGKFILKLRKEKNMSQMDLAEKLGVTDRAISKWENGKGMPDLSLIQSLCRELGITINDLLSGEKIDKDNYQEKFEENVINTIKYSNERIIKSIAFYIAVFFLGIFIIPTLGIIAPLFIICAVITLLGGFIKLLGYIFNFNVPFIVFQIGTIELNPIIAFILSLMISAILYFTGKGAWKLLLRFMRKITEEQKKLEN